MESVPTWAAVIVTLLGGGVGAWILSIYKTWKEKNLEGQKQSQDHELANKKQATEIRISENEQAFRVYKDLVDNLSKSVNKMSEDMDKLEKDHICCREENAGLRAELRAVHKETEELRRQIVYKNSFLFREGIPGSGL